MFYTHTHIYIHKYTRKIRNIPAIPGREGWEVIIGGPIQLTQWLAQGPAQVIHHALDAGNVVVGGTNEGKQTLSWVLAQHSNTYGKENKFITSHTTSYHLSLWENI